MEPSVLSGCVAIADPPGLHSTGHRELPDLGHGRQRELLQPDRPLDPTTSRKIIGGQAGDRQRPHTRRSGGFLVADRHGRLTAKGR